MSMIIISKSLEKMNKCRVSQSLIEIKNAESYIITKVNRHKYYLAAHFRLNHIKSLNTANSLNI